MTTCHESYFWPFETLQILIFEISSNKINQGANICTIYQNDVQKKQDRI
jgi:hypothetical protein